MPYKIFHRYKIKITVSRNVTKQKPTFIAQKLNSYIKTNKLTVTTSLVTRYSNKYNGLNHFRATLSICNYTKHRIGNSYTKGSVSRHWEESTIYFLRTLVPCCPWRMLSQANGTLTRYSKGLRFRIIDLAISWSINCVTIQF